jgi:hypothetical protein
LSAEIKELIAQYDGDSGDVATAVTLQVMTNKNLKGVVQDIVLGYVKHQVTAHRRAEARRVEDRAYAHGDPFEEVIGELPLANPMAARQELLREKFFCPHCLLYVTWGEATAECHGARAQYMMTLARTVVQDAERHQAAADRLRQHGAKNLNELDRAARAKVSSR